jgi:UPF0271 protein
MSADFRLIILDTAVFLQGASFSRKDIDVAVPEEVITEVKSRVPKLRLEQLIAQGSLQIRGATKTGIEEAKQFAEETGDLQNLSSADIGVIALACEQKKLGIEPIVYTGDYSIQNVLKSQGVKFKSIANDGIKQTIKWVFKCEACESKFKKQPEGNTCPDCGTVGMIKRIPSK